MPPTGRRGPTSGRTSRGCCTTMASAGRTTSARTVASGPRAASRRRRPRPFRTRYRGSRPSKVTKQLKNIRVEHGVLRRGGERHPPVGVVGRADPGESEHPPDSIAIGQAWVTKVVNAVMQGPDQWLQTAIFVTWDDWGGFYDHVSPPRSTRTATGSASPAFDQPVGTTRLHRPSDVVVRRVPEARSRTGSSAGSGSTRTDGWPDSRPTVRENAPQLGDLSQEFNFKQQPIPPLVLDPTP